MRFPLTTVPRDPAGVARPLLSVDIEGINEAVTFLIDTGSIHNRLPSEWATAAGIGLEAHEVQIVGMGGQPNVVCHVVDDVQTTVGDMALTLTIHFCDGWDAPFGLLGQEGFLQYFHFALSVMEEWFELTET